MQNHNLKNQQTNSNDKINENWYNLSSEKIAEKLNSNLENGLTDDEVKNKQERYGFNEIASKKKKSIFIKFLEQFKDFMIIVLLIAAIISGIIGQINGEGMSDTIIILIVVVANAIIGVFQEYKAEKSLEALKKLSSHTAKVIRNGKLVTLESRELVIGDIVIMEAGDYIPADIRIIESMNLKTQESTLTGESVPVEKIAETISENSTLGIADRVNMAFSSSLVTYGRGKGIVVETGMNTEVGKIAGMINSTDKEITPLQEKLNKLGKTLGIAALAICAVIFFIGLAYGKEPINMFMIAVSLAVAAIPEGLAAVSTIVLAIGVQRMVKKHAIVKRLPAVETLGSTSVICTDKTGTLTQNKMTVKNIYINGELKKVEEVEDTDELKKLVYVSMLCNDTKIDSDSTLIGDPTETALVDMGFKLKFNPSKFDQYARVAEIPFDSDRKLMTTICEAGDGYIADTKGGIDELLAKCNSYIENGQKYEITPQFLEKLSMINEKMASKALRVLAMAYKEYDHIPDKNEMSLVEEDLTFVGMVGMIDPPREEVKAAIEKCKTAGIKTVMITGDHKITAIAIAKELGILQNEEEAISGSELEAMSDEELIKNVKKYSVYARVSPEHKVRIVKAWQSYGEIVAMTGDGVNDAPALKTANIGCAMGKVGTDVAKEAADVILTDDNFATIVDAVEEGRRIYDNILKVIQFLLSSNIGEIIVLFLSILITPWLSAEFNIDINLIEIFLVTQLLWINLVTDSLPALALSTDPADKNIMKRKPNKTKGVFTKGMTFRIIYQGIVIGIISLIAFIIGLSISNNEILNLQTKYPGLTDEKIKVEVGQTMAFVVISFAELVHIFNIRNNKESIFKTGIGGNKLLFIGLGIATILMLSVIVIPGLQGLFDIIVLPKSKIIECIVLVLSPVFVVELMKLLKINTSKDEN